MSSILKNKWFQGIAAAAVIAIGFFTYQANTETDTTETATAETAATPAAEANVETVNASDAVQAPEAGTESVSTEVTSEVNADITETVYIKDENLEVTEVELDNK